MSLAAITPTATRRPSSARARLKAEFRRLSKRLAEPLRGTGLEVDGFRDGHLEALTLQAIPRPVPGESRFLLAFRESLGFVVLFAVYNPDGTRLAAQAIRFEDLTEDVCRLALARLPEVLVVIQREIDSLADFYGEAAAHARTVTKVEPLQ